VENIRVGNRLDATRTNALLSQPETGKINCVRLPHYGRLPPGAYQKRTPQRSLGSSWRAPANFSPRKCPMLLVKTYIDQSAIHGLGVFADEFIRKGKKIWRFVEGYDRIYSPKQFAELPKAAKDFVRFYGYRVDGEIILTVDHDRNINHSENANTVWQSGYSIARRNIRKGEEITNDYRDIDPVFCAAFLNKK
jgi:hypothetical protein